jgi:subtilisin
MELEDQLAAFGHARVVVVLKPKRTRREGSRTELALAETISLQQDVAAKLGPVFKTFTNSRTQVIAKEAAQMARRSIVANAIADAPPPPTSRRRPPPARYFPNLGVMLGTVDRRGLTNLRKRDREVAAVLAAPEISLIAPVEDAALAGPPAGVSWGIQRLGVPAAWDRGLTGKGVLIAHLDTGIDVTHPALANAVDVFAEFDLIGDLVTAPERRDTRFHGTHTAGLMVGQPHAGLTFGVAPQAKLASAVVIEGGDVPARTIAALDWAIAQGCRIANLSLGIRGYEPQFSVILRLLRQRGVLPVVAVGNEGALTSRSPGNHVEVLSVGAVDETDNVWIQSSSQTLPTTPPRAVPDLVAPGAGVWSTMPNQQMSSLSGTSMATPHVAGLAALLFEHRPEATVDQVEAAIYASCRRPGSISTVRGNRGVPDAIRALNLLDQGA